SKHVDATGGDRSGVHHTDGVAREVHTVEATEAIAQLGASPELDGRLADQVVAGTLGPAVGTGEGDVQEVPVLAVVDEQGGDAAGHAVVAVAEIVGIVGARVVIAVGHRLPGDAVAQAGIPVAVHGRDTGGENVVEGVGVGRVFHKRHGPRAGPLVT